MSETMLSLWKAYPSDMAWRMRVEISLCAMPEAAASATGYAGRDPWACFEDLKEKAIHAESFHEAFIQERAWAERAQIEAALASSGSSGRSGKTRL